MMAMCSRKLHDAMLARTRTRRGSSYTMPKGEEEEGSTHNDMALTRRCDCIAALSVALELYGRSQSSRHLGDPKPNTCRPIYTRPKDQKSVGHAGRIGTYAVGIKPARLSPRDGSPQVMSRLDGWW